TVHRLAAGHQGRDRGRDLPAAKEQFGDGGAHRRRLCDRADMNDTYGIADALSGRSDEPVLFYSPGACSLASHIALEETDRPYRSIEVLLASKQHLTDDYRAINPRGQVPALIAKGQVF